MSRKSLRMKQHLVPLALGWALSFLAPLGSAQEGNQGSSPPATPAGSPTGASEGAETPVPAGRDVVPPVVKPSPNLGPSLRRALRSPNGAAPGPGANAPDPSGSRPASAWNGRRGWEIWWELYRDRFVRLEPRDTSIVVGQVPADPRTSVQWVGTRVGAYERIEPSLRSLLTHESSELVRSRALLALAKLGENPLVAGSRTSYATILPFIYHNDAHLADAAITALGILGTEDALFPLGDLIEGVHRSPSDPEATSETVGTKPCSDRQRALALYAMGLIGRDSDREDVRRLVASRICAQFSRDADVSAEVKFAALHALSLVPLAADSSAQHVESVDKPRKSRGFGEPRIARSPRKNPAPAIPSASRATEIEWVLSILDDEGEAGWIRAQAVTAAARLCSDLEDGSATERRVVERLLKSLAPRSPDCVEIEQSAALALGELGDGDSDELDARVRGALVATSQDAANQPTREFAIMSLALVGSRPGGNVGESDRLSASSEVRRILVRRVSSARSDELPWAALALGIFERGMLDASGAASRESRTLLTDLLIETNSAESAAACALASGLCGASEARSELVSRLRDGDVAVRSYASLALGMSGARDAAPAIERVLGEARQFPELYRETSEALTLLGAQVSRQLLGMLAGGASLESKMSLCLALGRVGDGKSLRALCQVASDPVGKLWVRAAATSALGTLGSQRGGDWKGELGHALNFLCVPPSLSAASLDGLLDLD